MLSFNSFFSSHSASVRQEAREWLRLSVRWRCAGVFTRPWQMGVLDFSWTLPTWELPWLPVHKLYGQGNPVWYGEHTGSLLTSAHNLARGFLFPAREFWGNTAFKFWCGFEGHIGLERHWFRIGHRKEQMEFGKKVIMTVIIIINFSKSLKMTI